MSGKCNFSIKQEGNVFFIAGIIDERADFSPITDSKEDPIIIDQSGITRISSSGVRAWSFMITKLNQQKVIYQKCPVLMVDQLNMITEMLRHAEVKNFELPFYCPKCDLEEELLIDVATVRKDQFKENLESFHKCSQCKNHMEFNEVIEKYFSFLEPNEYNT